MSIKQYISTNCLLGRWNIGFILDPIDSILFGSDSMKIHWLNHNFSNRWFADPFILNIDNDYLYVLVEDFVRGKNKAQISLLTIERTNYTLKNIDVILEEPTHLSFPAILRNNDDILIYPENGASGALKMYKYNLQKKRCEFLNALINKDVADAVLFKIKGDTYLITTEGEEMNGRILNFYKKTDRGYDLDHQIAFDRDIARNAGAWFEFNGKYYRPAQDCGIRYGAALELQEFNPLDFSLRTIRRFEPTSSKYNLGIHTFNHYKGISVVDGYGYDHPLLAKLFNLLLCIKNYGK